MRDDYIIHNLARGTSARATQTLVPACGGPLARYFSGYSEDVNCPACIAMRDIAPAIKGELRRLVQTLRAMDSWVQGLPPGSDRPWYAQVTADEVDLLLAKIDGARTSGGVASPIDWAPESEEALLSAVKAVQAMEPRLLGYPPISDLPWDIRAEVSAAESLFARLAEARESGTWTSTEWILAGGMAGT